MDPTKERFPGQQAVGSRMKSAGYRPDGRAAIYGARRTTAHIAEEVSDGFGGVIAEASRMEDLCRSGSVRIDRCQGSRSRTRLLATD
jgi:hypothetical protein